MTAAVPVTGHVLSAEFSSGWFHSNPVSVYAIHTLCCLRVTHVKAGAGYLAHGHTTNRSWARF